MSGAITAGTLATVAGIGAAGSIGGALIGSNSAGNAAKAQENAANNAAQLQYQESKDALDFQKQQWNQSQQNMTPWLQTGAGALGNLGYLLGVTPNTSVGQQTQVPSSGAPITSNPTGNAARGISSLNSSTPGMAPQSGAAPATSSVPGSSGLSLSAPQAGAARGIQGINQTNPGLTAGSGATPAGGSFGSLMQGYGQTFQAPTDITEQNDPGYQARLKLGTDAIQRSAAARGNVLTGGTAKALDTYGQDYASNEYNNVYNRALQGYNTNYNVWNNDQTNQFNRLASLAGAGQTAATNLSNAGANTANAVSSNLLGTGAQIGQDYQNAGAANASGIVGSGNAWNSALGGIGGNLSQLLLLKQLGMGGGNGTLNWLNNASSDGLAVM